MVWNCKQFASDFSTAVFNFWRRWLVFAVLIIAGCSPSPPPPASPAKKTVVLTSFAPAFSLAANVAGGLANVQNLSAGTVGPHDYQFSPQDLKRIRAADVLVVNGLQLEPWLERLKESLAGATKPVIVELAAGVQDKELLFDADEGGEAKEHHDHAHDAANPHIWLDPLLACRAVTNIMGALSGIDPGNAEGYGQNAAACVKRLEAVHAEYNRALEGIKERNIVTFHSAFPYLARRYHLNIVGVVEEVPDVSPSPRYLSHLHQIIREKNVSVIFTEPQFSPRLGEQMARDLNTPVAELDTMETGELSPRFYEDAMYRNLQTLLQYLH